MDLKRLQEYFKPSAITWRIGVLSQDKTKGIALPYLTNRAVQNRLDSVCGPENWKNEYLPWKEKAQLCGISIRIDGEWVTKWDGADDSKTEPTKGGLSDSMKRAAVQWGIGRYLYDLPTYWVDVVPSGKTYKIARLPKLPKEYLPEGTSDNYSYAEDGADAMSPEEEQFNKMLTADTKNTKLDGPLLHAVEEWCIAYHMNPKSIAKLYKKEVLSDMTISDYWNLLEKMKARFPDFEAYEKDRQEREANEINKNIK